MLSTPEVGQILHLRAYASSEAHAWQQGLVWRVMQVFGFLANTILALVLQAALDASLTGPFITCQAVESALITIRAGDSRCLQQGSHRD